MHSDRQESSRHTFHKNATGLAQERSASQFQENLVSSLFSDIFKDLKPVPRVKEKAHKTAYPSSQVGISNSNSLQPRHELPAVSDSGVGQPSLVNKSNSSYAHLDASSSIAQNVLKNISLLGLAFSSSGGTYSHKDSIVASTGTWHGPSGDSHVTSTTCSDDRMSLGNAGQPTSTTTSSSSTRDQVISDVLKSIGFNVDMSKLSSRVTREDEQSDPFICSRVSDSSSSITQPVSVPSLQAVDPEQTTETLTTAHGLHKFVDLNRLSEIDKLLQKVRRLHSMSPVKDRARSGSDDRSYSDSREAERLTAREERSRPRRRKQKRQKEEQWERDAKRSRRDDRSSSRCRMSGRRPSPVACHFDSIATLRKLQSSHSSSLSPRRSLKSTAYDDRRFPLSPFRTRNPPYANPHVWENVASDTKSREDVEWKKSTEEFLRKLQEPSQPSAAHAAQCDSIDVDSDVSNISLGSLSDDMDVGDDVVSKKSPEIPAYKSTGQLSRSSPQPSCNLTLGIASCQSKDKLKNEDGVSSRDDGMSKDSQQFEKEAGLHRTRRNKRTSPSDMSKPRRTDDRQHSKTSLHHQDVGYSKQNLEERYGDYGCRKMDKLSGDTRHYRSSSGHDGNEGVVCIVCGICHFRKHCKNSDIRPRSKEMVEYRDQGNHHCRDSNETSETTSSILEQSAAHEQVRRTSPQLAKTKMQSKQSTCKSHSAADDDRKHCGLTHHEMYKKYAPNENHSKNLSDLNSTTRHRQHEKSEEVCQEKHAVSSIVEPENQLKDKKEQARSVDVKENNNIVDDTGLNDISDASITGSNNVQDENKTQAEAEHKTEQKDSEGLECEQGPSKSPDESHHSIKSVTYDEKNSEKLSCSETDHLQCDLMELKTVNEPQPTSNSLSAAGVSSESLTLSLAADEAKEKLRNDNGMSEHHDGKSKGQDGISRHFQQSEKEAGLSHTRRSHRMSASDTIKPRTTEEEYSELLHHYPGYRHDGRYSKQKAEERLTHRTGRKINKPSLYTRQNTSSGRDSSSHLEKSRIHEDVSSSKEVVEYKDWGNHQCRGCGEMFETTSSLLEHLQLAAHQQRDGRRESPPDGNNKGRLHRKTEEAARGAEYLVAVTAPFYCHLCRCYISTIIQAQWHLLSAAHNEKYKQRVAVLKSENYSRGTHDRQKQKLTPEKDSHVKGIKKLCTSLTIEKKERMNRPENNISDSFVEPLDSACSLSVDEETPANAEATCNVMMLTVDRIENEQKDECEACDVDDAAEDILGGEAAKVHLSDLEKSNVPADFSSKFSGSTQYSKKIVSSVLESLLASIPELCTDEENKSQAGMSSECNAELLITGDDNLLQHFEERKLSVQPKQSVMDEDSAILPFYSVACSADAKDIETCMPVGAMEHDDVVMSVMNNMLELCDSHDLSLSTLPRVTDPAETGGCDDRYTDLMYCSEVNADRSGNMVTTSETCSDSDQTGSVRKMSDGSSDLPVGEEKSDGNSAEKFNVHNDPTAGEEMSDGNCSPSVEDEKSDKKYHSDIRFLKSDTTIAGEEWDGNDVKCEPSAASGSSVVVEDGKEDDQSHESSCPPSANDQAASTPELLSDTSESEKMLHKDESDCSEAVCGSAISADAVLKGKEPSFSQPREGLNEPNAKICGIECCSLNEVTTEKEDAAGNMLTSSTSLESALIESIVPHVIDDALDKSVDGDIVGIVNPRMSDVARESCVASSIEPVVETAEYWNSAASSVSCPSDDQHDIAHVNNDQSMSECVRVECDADGDEELQPDAEEVAGRGDDDDDFEIELL